IGRRSDGQIRQIHSRATWDSSSGRMFGVIRDVTKEKEAQEQIERFNSELEKLVASRTGELNAANAQLSSAMKEIQIKQEELVLSEKLATIGQLSANIAHEMNTPLGAMISATGS